MQLGHSIDGGARQRNGGDRTSIAALRGNRRVGVYGMSKAANAQLARNLAGEWAASGVRGNAVAPGLVMTAFTKGQLKNDVVLARRLHVSRHEFTHDAQAVSA